MPWTETTRPQTVRHGRRYASDTTDEEWALIAPFMPPERPVGRPPHNGPARRVRCDFLHRGYRLPVADVAERLSAGVHGARIFPRLARRRALAHDRSPERTSNSFNLASAKCHNRTWRNMTHPVNSFVGNQKYQPRQIVDQADLSWIWIGKHRAVFFFKAERGRSELA